jgi:hypothetical protein
MQVLSCGDWRQRLALAGLLIIVSLQLMSLTSYAQNLGQQPATGQAVQGQTAAQPEGAVLNLVNWVRFEIGIYRLDLRKTLRRSRKHQRPPSFLSFAGRCNRSDLLSTFERCFCGLPSAKRSSMLQRPTVGTRNRARSR